MSGDVVARAKAALEGVTDGPWTHCTGPHPESGETHAEYLAGTLIGEGEPLHVLVSASNDPRYAYRVPALTGDGPTSGRNAEFIAAARSLVPELVTEVKRLREALSEAWDDGNGTGLDGWVGPGRGTLPIDEQAVYNRTRCLDKLTYPAVWS